MMMTMTMTMILSKKLKKRINASFLQKKKKIKKKDGHMQTVKKKAF